MLEVTLAVRGYYDHNQVAYRTRWETARFIAYNSLAAMNGTKKLGSVTKFYPLPWDDVYRHKKITNEQRKRGDRIAKAWREIPVGENTKPLKMADFMKREKLHNG